EVVAAPQEGTEAPPAGPQERQRGLLQRPRLLQGGPRLVRRRLVPPVLRLRPGPAQLLLLRHVGRAEPGQLLAELAGLVEHRDLPAPGERLQAAGLLDEPPGLL